MCHAITNLDQIKLNVCFFLPKETFRRDTKILYPEIG